MAHINLLPWREELRLQRNRDFGVHCAIFALLMGGVFGAVHYFFVDQTKLQTQRNDFIKTEIAQLDKKIEEIKELDAEKARLVARMEIIEELQSSRPEIVHLFDELVKTIPEGIFYKRITQRGRQLTVLGVAQSNARVSSLMRKLDDSEWLEDPALVEIKRIPQQQNQEEGERFSDFTMVVTQTNRLKPDADEAGEGS